MFDQKIIALGDGMMALTTAEAIELQKYLETKGLVIVQPVAVTEKKPEVEEVKESENVNLMLIKSGGIIGLAKALKSRMEISAIDVKKMAEGVPSIVFENIPRAEGNKILSEFANELDQSQFVFELRDVK